MSSHFIKCNYPQHSRIYKSWCEINYEYDGGKQQQKNAWWNSLRYGSSFSISFSAVAVSELLHLFKHTNTQWYLILRIYIYTYIPQQCSEVRMKGKENLLQMSLIHGLSCHPELFIIFFFCEILSALFFLISCHISLVESEKGTFNEWNSSAYFYISFSVAFLSFIANGKKIWKQETSMRICGWDMRIHLMRWDEEVRKLNEWEEEVNLSFWNHEWKMKRNFFCIQKINGEIRGKLLMSSSKKIKRER